MREDIVSFVGEDEGLPFFVSMCGISYCDGSYRIERINSETCVMEYIVSGSGTVHEGKNSFIASGGDIYYLKNGRDHLYYSDADEPWTKMWMNFEGELAKSITECYGLSDRAHFRAPELKKYFSEIIDISRSAGGARIISEKIAVVFLKIVQHLAGNENSDAAVSPVARGIKEYIDNTTDFGITLDEIASKIYCSKCHAIREFRAEYGVTPYEYMLRKRFAAAAAMLKNTALPVSDIAEKTGFCDAHYFSGCFSKRFGVSPSAYRKNKLK